jgi:hypothetical protein
VALRAITRFFFTKSSILKILLILSNLSVVLS